MEPSNALSALEKKNQTIIDWLLPLPILIITPFMVEIGVNLNSAPNEKSYAFLMIMWCTGSMVYVAFDEGRNQLFWATFFYTFCGLILGGIPW